MFRAVSKEFPFPIRTKQLFINFPVNNRVYLLKRYEYCNDIYGRGFNAGPLR